MSFRKDVAYVRTTGAAIHKSEGLDVRMVGKRKCNREKKMGSIKRV
jgi:hypothetical protein